MGVLPAKQETTKWAFYHSFPSATSNCSQKCKPIEIFFHCGECPRPKQVTHIIYIYIYTVCIVYRLAHQIPKQFGLTNGSLKLWPIFLASRGRVPRRQQLSPQSGRMPPATVLYWCLLSSESETTNKLTIQVIRSQHRHSHCGFWLCFAVKNLASLSAQPKGLPHVC